MKEKYITDRLSAGGCGATVRARCRNGSMIYCLPKEIAAPRRGVRLAIPCYVPKFSVGFLVRWFTEDPQEITGFWFVGLP